MLSALAQETRMEVFRLLIKEGPDGLSAGKIAEIMQVPAATMSFHLSSLASAGLLKSKKDGRIIFYSAKNKSIKNLYKFLTENSYKKRMEKNSGEEFSEETNLDGE